MSTIYLTLETFNNEIKDIQCHSTDVYDDAIYMIWSIKVQMLQPNTPNQLRIIECSHELPENPNNLPIRHVVDDESLGNSSLDINYISHKEYKALSLVKKEHHEETNETTANIISTTPMKPFNLSEKNLELMQKDFNNHLKAFKEKCDSLDLRSQKAPSRKDLRQVANKATSLWGSLKTNAENYFDNHSMSKQQFITQCMTDINADRPIFEKYRNLKIVVAELALFFLGLGVGYIAAGLINKAVTGHFTFFRTDSAKKIDRLEADVKDFNPIMR